MSLELCTGSHRVNTTIPPQDAIEEHMEAQPEAEPNAEDEELKLPV